MTTDDTRPATRATTTADARRAPSPQALYVAALEQLEDVLNGRQEIAKLVGKPGVELHGPDGRAAEPDFSTTLVNLAETVDRLDAIRRRERLQAPPPFDVEQLIARVWNATQEAGAATAVGDAAADAIRDFTRGDR